MFYFSKSVLTLYIDLGDNAEVPLPNIEESILQQVVAYLNEYHSEKDKALNAGTNFLPEVNLADPKDYKPDTWEEKYVDGEVAEIMALADVCKIFI